jgi:hypothetical protein
VVHASGVWKENLRPELSVSEVQMRDFCHV